MTENICKRCDQKGISLQNLQTPYTAQYQENEQPHKKMVSRGFPGGLVVKNPPANTGDTGSIPRLGRPPHAMEQISSCKTASESTHHKY